MIAENLKKLYNKIVISIALIILIVISSLSTIAYSHELYYINGQKYPVRWYWKITEGGVTKLYIKTNSDYLKSPFVEVYNNALNNWNNAWSLNSSSSFARSLNLKIHTYSHVKFENTSFNSAKLFFATPTKEWWKATVGNNGNIWRLAFITNTDGIQITESNVIGINN